jgi:hypothetical protein
MILFSNKLLTTSQKSVFFCSGYNKKISVLSSIDRDMSEKKFLLGRKVNKSFYVLCSINMKQIEDEYLRVFINPDDRVNSYNGVFISKEMFKIVCGEEICSLTIKKVIKLAIFGEGTIITMLHKGAIPMYFLLHQELGWVNITEYWDDDVSEEDMYNLYSSIIHDTI